MRSVTGLWSRKDALRHLAANHLWRRLRRRGSVPSGSSSDAGRPAHRSPRTRSQGSPCWQPEVTAMQPGRRWRHGCVGTVPIRSGGGWCADRRRQRRTLGVGIKKGPALAGPHCPVEAQECTPHKRSGGRSQNSMRGIAGHAFADGNLNGGGRMNERHDTKKEAVQTHRDRLGCSKRNA